MTDVEIARALALNQCSFLPGSTDKAAARKYAYWATMNARYELTPAQQAQIERLAWKYRKQIPIHLVPAGDPAKRKGK